MLEKYKYIIMVGAGASCDYSKNQKCPPLGKNLAKRLREHIPEFKKIEKNIGRCNSGNFEEWTGGIGDPKNYTNVLWCISNFFSGFYISAHDSLYSQLIKKIKHEIIKNTIFVSFNYETLLELALKKNRYEIDYELDTKNDFFNVEQKENKVKVLKPHGSCNFRLDTPCGNTVFDFSSQISGDNIRIDHPKNVHKEINCNTGALPSLVSAYNKNKATNLNKANVDKIRDLSKEYAKTCEKIVIIGIRYQSHDESVNNIVKSALEAGAEMIFVSPDDDDKDSEKSFSGFCSLVENNKKVSHLKGTFREKMDDIVAFLEK